MDLPSKEIALLYENINANQSSSNKNYGIFLSPEDGPKGTFEIISAKNPKDLLKQVLFKFQLLDQETLDENPDMLSSENVDITKLRSRTSKDRNAYWINAFDEDIAFYALEL